MTDGQFSRAVNSVNFRTFKFDLTFVSFFSVWLKKSVCTISSSIQFGRKCYENNLKNNDELSDKFSVFVEVDILPFYA